MKLNLNVPINSLGYGVVGFNLWQELTKKIDVTLWPIGDIRPPRNVEEEVISLLRRDIDKQSEFNPALPTLKVWHENQMAERIGTGPLYGFPFFEVSEFDRRRLTHIESCDRVIVASNWAKTILEEQSRFTSNDISVVPCGVDRSIFNETNNKPNKNKCVFMTCGKWEYRKGHDVLHMIFKRAFEGVNDVELWLMCDNPFLNEQERQAWEFLYKDDPRFRLISRVEYQEQLADIMSEVFCGIFLSRAEGWNLEALEMMSMGKHVIITNTSAHTEFCNQDNSFLIPISSYEPMYDGKWFRKNCGFWADLDADATLHAVHYLQTAYEAWKANPAAVNQNGIETAKVLSWESTADKIIGALSEHPQDS